MAGRLDHSDILSGHLPEVTKADDTSDSLDETLRAAQQLDTTSSTARRWLHQRLDIPFCTHTATEILQPRATFNVNRQHRESTAA